MPDAEQIQAPPEPLSQIEQAFEICKMQAMIDGTVDETLMRNWFQAAWELCADMIGLEPPQEIEEAICINEWGGFRLSRTPTSDVRIYDGYTLVTVIPRHMLRSPCTPALCCLCKPVAKYMIGEETCEFSANFIQAVARVFAFIMENRGDGDMRAPVDLDDQVLKRSGALAFLRPHLTFVA